MSAPPPRTGAEASLTASHLWTWEDIMHRPEQEQPELIAGQPYARAIARGTHGPRRHAAGAAGRPYRQS